MTVYIENNYQTIIKEPQKEAFSPSHQESPTPPLEIVSLSEAPEMTSRPYLLEHYIPEGYTTILYGDGGVGKSILAMTWALCITSGVPFLGFSTKQLSSVLYVDFELAAPEQRARAEEVARGLGTNLGDKLQYTNPARRLPDVLDDIKRHSEAKLVIIDSVGAGAGGQDQQTEQFATELFQKIAPLERTFLLIDHQAKGEGNYWAKKPYGSAYKFNLARSVIQIGPPGAKDLVVQHQKHNFGDCQPPLKLRVCFEEGRIQYHPVAGAPSNVEELVAERDEAGQRVMEALWNRLGDQDFLEVEAQEIAPQVGCSANVVGRILSRLGFEPRRMASSRKWAISRSELRGLAEDPASPLPD